MTQKCRSGHAAPKIGSPFWLPTALRLTSKSLIMMSSPWRSDLYHLSSLTFLHPIPPHILQTRLLETSHTMSPPLWGLHICYTLHLGQPSSNSSSSPSKPISATTSSKKPSILPHCHPVCDQPLLHHWKKTPNHLSHSTCYTALSATNYMSLLPGFQPTASSQLQSRAVSYSPPTREYPALCLVHSRCSVNSSKMNQWISKWRKYWTVRNIPLSTLLSHFKTCLKCLLSQVTLFVKIHSFEFQKIISPKPKEVISNNSSAAQIYPSLLYRTYITLRECLHESH